MNTGQIISQTALNSYGLGKLMLEGVTEDRFARLADGPDGPIKSNHPAFIYGHLSLYPAGVCKLLGDDQCATEIAPPESWMELFSAGKECQDDPNGDIYPPMKEIVDVFSNGYQRVVAVIGRTPDDVLDRENPNEGLRDRLGLKSVGAAVNFIMTSHPMMHLGQMSAWRRMQGLGAALKF